MYSCSEQLYFISIMILLSVVCCLSTASSVVIAFGRNLTGYHCFLFTTMYKKSVYGQYLPCNVVMYCYTVIAAWSLLSIIGHGLCSFWRTLTCCIRFSFGVAAVVTVVSWVSSVILTTGFATWCGWIKDNTTTSGCYHAASVFDLRNNSTDMETFFFLGCGTQSSGWVITILCCTICIMYLQSCCCKHSLHQEVEDKTQLLKTET